MEKKELYIVLPIADNHPALSIGSKLEIDTQAQDIRSQQSVTKTSDFFSEKWEKNEAITGQELQNELGGPVVNITIGSKAMASFHELQCEGNIILCELNDEKDKIIVAYTWHPERKSPTVAA